LWLASFVLLLLAGLADEIREHQEESSRIPEHSIEHDQYPFDEFLVLVRLQNSQRTDRNSSNFGLKLQTPFIYSPVFIFNTPGEFEAISKSVIQKPFLEHILDANAP
jgi:hypothetical protein